MKQYFEPYIDLKNSLEDTMLLQRNPNILKSEENKRGSEDQLT